MSAVAEVMVSAPESASTSCYFNGPDTDVFYTKIQVQGQSMGGNAATDDRVRNVLSHTNIHGERNYER